MTNRSSPEASYSSGGRACRDASETGEDNRPNCSGSGPVRFNTTHSAVARLMIQPSLHPYYPAPADALRVNDSRKTQAATKMRNIKCPHWIFRLDYLVVEGPGKIGAYVCRLRCRWPRCPHTRTAGRDRISARPTTYLTENCCERDAACTPLCDPAPGCGAGETAETTAA